MTGPGMLSTKVLGENHRVCWGAPHSSSLSQGDQPGRPVTCPVSPQQGLMCPQPPAPRPFSLLPESLLSAQVLLLNPQEARPGAGGPAPGSGPPSPGSHTHLPEDSPPQHGCRAWLPPQGTGGPWRGSGSSLQPSSPETHKGWPRLERERPARLERPPTATAETPGGRKQVQEGHAEAHAPPWKNPRPLQSPRTLAQCLWGPLWAAERATPRTGEGQAAPPAAPAAQPPRPGPTSDLGTWG